MSEPITLPDNPEIKDLAKAVRQSHDCLEKARAEIRQTNVALVTVQNKLVSLETLPWQITKRMLKWLGPIIIGSVVASMIQNYMQNQAAVQTAAAAAHSSQTTAAAQTVVVRKLDSLGAAP